MARPRAWGDVLLQSTISSGGALLTDLLANLSPSDTVTVIRLVGDLQFTPSAVSSVVDGTQVIDVGIGVASEEAFLATIVPDANAAGEQPARGWLYVARRVLYQAVDAGPLDRFIYPQFRFDIGSQRKVDRGRLYMTIHNSSDLGASQSVRVTGRVRALCLT